MGNLHSVKKVLDKLQVRNSITNNPKEIQRAERIILPGVGHFGMAMQHLKNLDILPVLNEAAFEKKIPILGICLGMQLMTEGSDEGGENGLGWFSCRTEKMNVKNHLNFKIPHIGWNTLNHAENNTILENVPNKSEVYFVHSYGVINAPEEEILTTTDYEFTFISSLRKSNLVGMQFHPEKSHNIGSQLINNFIHLT
jgi:glutamine amidotransferase